MAKGEEGLMEVWKSGRHRAAVPATADHQNSNRPFQQLGMEIVGHHSPVSSFFKCWFNVSSSTSVDCGNRAFPARLFQSAVVPPLRFVKRPPPPGWVNSLWKKACCQAAIEVTVKDFG